MSYGPCQDDDFPRCDECGIFAGEKCPHGPGAACGYPHRATFQVELVTHDPERCRIHPCLACALRLQED